MRAKFLIFKLDAGEYSAHCHICIDQVNMSHYIGIPTSFGKKMWLFPADSKPKKSSSRNDYVLCEINTVLVKKSGEIKIHCIQEF